MHYAVSPPEVNSGRMFYGPRSGPADSFRSVTAGVTDQWRRGGGVSTPSSRRQAYLAGMGYTVGSTPADDRP